MIAKLSSSLLCALVLASCASSQSTGVAQAQASPMCANPGTAQQAGYADGTNGTPSQASWFQTTCAPEQSQVLASAYQEAYARGANERGARIAQANEAARQAEIQHVQRLCTDPTSAYQAGYNAGYRREPMSADWADQYCSPQHRVGTKQSYMTGFQAGMNQAPPPPQPTMVPVVVVGATVGTTTQDACRFSSDCGAGDSCRHVSELGHNVCMGHGLRGDYCWFDSDCGSDECRLRTGGAKTCD
jgi:hypothetical protein